ncbi:ninein-like [Portunus trituberculatus]|uniref:ninein-like n=1 Tax=Portunus trituberculatus TaxID=210409 RepID=UPI001E1CE49A|nr:ninein-like [Portunus trituberculatus]
MGNRTFRPTTRHSHTRLWPGRGMNRRAASASRAPPTTMEDPQVAVATHIGPSPRVSQSPESDMSPRAKRSLSPSPAPDSQSSSLAYSGDNEEEYLRATWQRLGVGHDGYLSLEELATVCHAIGMEKVANEVLEQLFSRLDVDGDGRISFEEFVHMFQNGGPSGNNSLVLDDSLPPDVPGSTLSCMSSASDERRGMVMSESSVFSSLDPDSTGYARVEALLEAWEGLNISNGPSLLRELALPHRPHESLCLRDLAAALESECQLPEEGAGGRVTLLQMALLTYLHEIKFLRLSVEAARGERDKLKQDLGEANQRVSLLAQDLDDHNARMEAASHLQLQELERQYKEQVRELQEAVVGEREAAREQVSAAAKELHAHNSHLQEEESRLKAALAALTADMKRLEAENMELSGKLQEAERQLLQMERQVADLHILKTKIAEYESEGPREEQYRRVVEQLQRVVAENQQLRDSNDELLSQLDSLPLRLPSARTSDKESSLDGSCLGDYMDPPVGLPAPVKRRGSSSNGSGEDSCEEESPRCSKVRRCSKGPNVHYVDVGSYDESFFDTSMSSLLKGSLVPSSHPDVISSAVEDAGTKSSHCSSDQNETEARAVRDEVEHINMHQQITRELKKVFDRVKDSVREEYKHDALRPLTPRDNPIALATREELEEEVNQLREERQQLSHRLQQQQEELKHQLEKKEFECEDLLKKVVRVEEQLRKVTSHLEPTSSPPPSPTGTPHTSTPIKANHNPAKDKCARCMDTQGQLAVALEELEMALRREEQERTERVAAQTLLDARQCSASECDSAPETTTTTTAYPPSSAGKLGVSPEQGRAYVLEERYREVEEQVAGLKLEIFKLCREAARSVQEGCEAVPWGERCRALLQKIQRRRQALAPRPQTPPPSEDSREEEQQSHQEETKQEEESASLQPSKDLLQRLEEEVQGLEEDLVRERDGLEKTRASLMEKNTKLEQDLELLRMEFDKSEDYWTLKLQEEQDYYEEERRLYDDKFSALERKIREYEELVLAGGGGAGGGRDASEESDRLSTIDESVVWEKQVTELEEEVAQLRGQLEDLRQEKLSMESQVETRVVEERQRASQERAILQEQVVSLASQLQQTQQQLSSVVEKGEDMKREADQRIQQLLNQQQQQSCEHLQVGSAQVNGHLQERGKSPQPKMYESVEKYHHEKEENFYIDICLQCPIINPFPSLSQQEFGSVGEETIKVSLRTQLRQCQDRLKFLETALRHHHVHAHHILTVTRAQHAAEVQNLESMMAATQQMLGQHIAKYKDQLSKASRSDSLVKELYLENAQLMRALQVTEGRQKMAEENSRKLQLSAALSTLS